MSVADSFVGAEIVGDMPTTIATILSRYYPAELRAVTSAFGVRVVALRPSERYVDVSPYLAKHHPKIDLRGAHGLFILGERTAYLRRVSTKTVVHEYAHALDLCLGGGTEYHSVRDDAIRRAFRCASGFVTPYAAMGVDEYFAESVRAFVGANDPDCPWPPATRERLRSIDPAMHAIVARFFGAAAERYANTYVCPGDLRGLRTAHGAVQ